VNRNTRKVISAVALALLAAVLIRAMLRLPPAGEHRSAYAEAVGRIAPLERHANAAVSAVVVDIRALDTLGEEFMVFASVAGLLLLLRLQPDEGRSRPRDHARGRRARPTSRAVLAGSAGTIPVLVLWGINVAAHGHLSPGGGFQGGVIIAMALLALYLARSIDAFKAAIPAAVVDAMESLAAGAFVLVGLAGIAAGAPFLADVLPLGARGQLASSGTILLLNLIIAIEVAAAFLAIFLTALEDALEREP
jgi:multicomponent Na+:H+ antiporter subunit B